MRNRAEWVMAACALIALAMAPDTQGQEVEVQSDPVEESIIEACAGAEHRQFDFWVGDWEVTDANGEVAGTNEITRVANGCGLSEYWRGAAGRNGTSLNWYDPAGGEWHQVWVGLGLYLHLKGGLEGNRMVLSGERATASGPVIDRISWTPQKSDQVRQLWEFSPDGGATWQVVFDGIYRRR